jgi:hypothetical protein
MANRMRSGKAYEHTVLGMLTLAGFDAYQPVVDDQGIDGVIRIRGNETEPPRYYEFQVKGANAWSGIRCKVDRMVRQGILILYCAAERDLLWFLYEEIGQIFPPINPKWGDVFLDQARVASFKAEGRDKLSELLRRLEATSPVDVAVLPGN